MGTLNASKMLVVVAFVLFIIAAILAGFVTSVTVPPLALVAGGLAAYMLALLVV